MDRTSKNAANLDKALTLLTEQERLAFFQWAEQKCEYNNVSRQMLFGHPYYRLNVVNGKLQTDVPLDYIQPDHRMAIEAFAATYKTAKRNFIGEILFFSIHSQSSESSTFSVGFSLAGLGAFCKSLKNSESLSSAELRTLAQLLTGTDLKNAALIDKVSYETKRTHAKALNAKLGFRRQADLVAELISELFLEVISSESNLHQTGSLENYLKRYLPRQTRLHTFPSSKGSPLRIIDLGPAKGRTVISVQTGIILANVHEKFMEMLHKENIRLLCPLRSGMIEREGPILPLEKHIDHAVEGIDAARQLAGIDTCTLHAVAAGSRIVLEYARRNPDVPNALLFQSIAGNSMPSLFSSMKVTTVLTTLALQNPLTLNLLLKFIDQKLTASGGAVRFLMQSFKKNPQDIELLNSKLKVPHLRDQIEYAISHSLTALIHDFQIMNNPCWDIAKHLDVPIHFIHGAEDTIVPLDHVCDLISAVGSGELYIVDGMARLSDCNMQATIGEYIGRVMDVGKR